MPAEGAILAIGKHVVIIGGGDTGADCLGTCHRQGALSVTQFELLPKPPDERAPLTPWPLWPMQLRTRGRARRGRHPRLERLHGAIHGRRRGQREAAPRRARRWQAASDSRHGVHDGGQPGAARDGLPGTGAQRDGWSNSASSSTRAANVATGENYMSSVPGVFAAGDMRRGQSLVVWAIAEGRKAAAAIDKYLTV